MPSNDPRVPRLAPLLKWAGGKERELAHILPRVPRFARYFDPFVGGGAVFCALRPAHAFVNDASTELITFYRQVAADSPLLHRGLRGLLAHWRYLGGLVEALASQLLTAFSQHRAVPERPLAGPTWPVVVARARDHVAGIFAPPLPPATERYEAQLWRCLTDKTRRMRQLEARHGPLSPVDVLANLESALKSALYCHCRALYNERAALGLAPGLSAALFFFVRENAYASMFRYNQRGELNVPYGGLTYNRKDLARKIAALRSPQLQHLLARTTIENLDFEEFLRRYRPQRDDFLFLDPPYDTEFSAYSGRAFTLDEHARLARYLTEPGRCVARFLLVIKSTPAILALYQRPGLHIHPFATTYRVSFQARNNRAAQHLIITNI
jgi:DNA adenine methylase